jgi:osmotically-inducible protein OsmY
MSTSIVSDNLQGLVESELAWDPRITSSTIGINARGGTVTLTGFVSSYAEKIAAEHAALRVIGVNSVANDLVVRLGNERIDPEVATEAANALRHNVSVPPTVKASVSNGYVSLEGVCEWNFQREAAERAVAHLAGVRGVTNHVTIAPRLSAVNAKSHIETALARNGNVDAGAVSVSTRGREVQLTGTVRSHAERREAEEAAWTAPGVAAVENSIAVRR